MPNPSDPPGDTSALSQLRRFSPIDEPPDTAHHRSWNWAVRLAVCCGLAGLPVGALVVLFSGGPLGMLLVASALLALIGGRIGARWGAAADRIAREREDENRKREEDLLLAQRLAEVRERMNDEPGP